MGPQQPPIAHLVELRHADAVFIGRHMLRDDIHRNLAQVEVRADPYGGSDPCRPQDVADDRHGHHVRGMHGTAGFQGLAPGLRLIEGQVGRAVYEHFIYGIHMDVLRRGIAQVY